MGSVAAGSWTELHSVLKTPGVQMPGRGESLHLQVRCCRHGSKVRTRLLPDGQEGDQVPGVGVEGDEQHRDDAVVVPRGVASL